MASFPLQQAYDLAVTHHREGRLREAGTVYREILAQEPNHPQSLHLLGVIAHQGGRSDIALSLIRRCISLKPDLPDAYCNLGATLSDIGQFREAIAAYRQAIALDPQYVEAHSNLGNALRAEGRLDEAVAACEKAIALNGGFAAAHNNLAQALLLMGDLRRGWEEFEWRSKCHDLPAARHGFAQPQWDGADLANRTILLHAEQGFGDMIQFIRYVPLVAERGGTIILSGYPELRRQLRKTAGLARWLEQDEPLPAFDVHCPLLSLPRAFGTTLDSIPAQVPYVLADPGLSEAWRARLSRYPKSFKVGLVWAGNPLNKNDPRRSMPAGELAPLLRVAGTRFFSLQKGDGAAQIGTLPGLVDWTAELHDFADTAALIENLDLVISVDTSVAHLGGAMAKTVWTMLPFSPDWRWRLARHDTPWYPTMRLFRQPSPADWRSVVSNVADALTLHVKRQPAPVG